LREVKGLVIHHRFLINSKLLNPDSSENLSLKCTILHELGLEHPSYTRQLFKTDCRAAFIIRSKSNLIMCQLEESTSTESQTSSTPMQHNFHMMPTNNGQRLSTPFPPTFHTMRSCQGLAMTQLSLSQQQVNSLSQQSFAGLPPPFSQQSGHQNYESESLNMLSLQENHNL
jgi:hypothetical protein